MTPNEGRVEAVYIAAESEAETAPVQRVSALAGRGLEGDRHFDKRSRRGGAAGKDLTLIEAEAIEGLRGDTGIELGLGEARRNVVTRGVRLNALVGRRFTVGDVECRGVELCEPCRHMERLTQPGVLRGLVGRGGLRADIVNGGEIAVGDLVRTLEA
jgi:MOSC domain-containing protein YiiM